MLPDKSILIVQKLVKNAKKIENSNATFQVIFKHCAFLVHELFEVEDFFEKSQIKNFKNRHWNPNLILNWDEKVDKF